MENLRALIENPSSVEAPLLVAKAALPSAARDLDGDGTDELEPDTRPTEAALASKKRFFDAKYSIATRHQSDINHTSIRSHENDRHAGR
ncbi:MAG: hypothetical protein N3F11_04570 [Casimicrobiaceae bacterium]|nr:hypothetical protein [Casimicrobiaceae bacterium]